MIPDTPDRHTDQGPPRHVYAIFEMAGREDDYKAFSYLTRLNECLGDQTRIEGRVLGPYRGPRLDGHALKIRSLAPWATVPHRQRLSRFFRALRKKLGLSTTYYWFSSLDVHHHRALRWMLTWNRTDAKAVIFARNIDTGVRLVELMFLYAGIIPEGIVVVLLDAQESSAGKLHSLDQWGVRILIDGSGYAPSSRSSFHIYRTLHFDSIHEMPLQPRRASHVDWNEELASTTLTQKNPEKVLFIRPDWMKCGSATTFGKLSTLLRDRGAILIDVALQPYKIPYDAATVAIKLAEVENDIGPSLHFNLRRGSRIYALLAIARGYLRDLPRTVAGFMPIFYEQCVAPSIVRKLIANANVDYVYVNHYFSLLAAKRLCNSKPLFLDTHDIQSLNFVSHEYHRHTRLRAAPFSACLQEELRIIDRADRVTMVSRDEIELVRRHRPRGEFFYYIPIPPPVPLQAVEMRKNEDEASVRLLIVASRNPANERSLYWFLNDIWPAVTGTGAHLDIVGSISLSFPENTFENVHFLGVIGDIAQIYQQADIVVLPITNGGGIAIKTLEAIQHGKPIVATRHALRGLPLAITEVLPGWLSDADLTADLTELIKSKEIRQLRANQSHRVRGILASIGFDDQMHMELDRMRALGHKIPFTEEKARAKRYVIAAPSNPGSKGDEGMMRGCLNLLASATDVVILTLESSPLWSDTVRTEQFCLFKEQTGPYPDFYGSLTHNDVLLILGADVIDGTCGTDASLQRVDLIRAALTAGAAVHVFCSFRSSVDPAIIDRLLQIPEARFYLRDLHSLERFKAQTRLKAEYFPDFFIFCEKTETALCRNVREALVNAKRQGKTIIGLNFSEHAFRSFSDVHNSKSRERYVADVLTVLARSVENPCFVLMSNDTRHWKNFPSDSYYQEQARQWLQNSGHASNILLLDPMITYPEILNLIGEFDIIVSGRMHLALASFRNRVTAICYMGTGKGYTSVDKMRGIFDKFLGEPTLVVSSLSGLETAIGLLQTQHHSLKEKLKKSMERIEKESLEKKQHLRITLQLTNHHEDYVIQDRNHDSIHLNQF
ncbi:Glycosyltransferase involved in cell wall bisynthesis [Nitrosovibrio sp. Nv17]|nr:Glycosyltransferase involved in cell wall bisynthesis [Nitrosovibrio sp. Nv17]